MIYQNFQNFSKNFENIHNNTIYFEIQYNKINSKITKIIQII
jgi:hypothetical protein